MKDVEKSRTSFIRVNLRGLREKHLFQCPRETLGSLFLVFSPKNADYLHVQKEIFVYLLRSAGPRAGWALHIEDVT